MEIIDVRRGYGIECSEFSYEIEHGLSVAEAWNIVDDILNSEIVRQKSNPGIKIPADMKAVEAIEQFSLKGTDRIFEVDIGAIARDFAKLERLWGIIKDNAGGIKGVWLAVSGEEEGPMWSNDISPGSGFEKVKKQIISDCKEMDDMGGVESFEYTMASYGDLSLAPVFCGIDFLDTNMSILYDGISKKIKKALPSLDFNFEVLFAVDWNIRYQDEYSGLTDVYVDWCSLILEKRDEEVDIRIRGHTDFTGQEKQIPKAVKKVLKRRKARK